MTDVDCITSWGKERDWMFAQHNGFSHFSLQLVTWNRSHFSGQGNITRLRVMLIFKCPSCQTFMLENGFGRAKKGSYQHVLNGNLESEKQKSNSAVKDRMHLGVSSNHFPYWEITAIIFCATGTIFKYWGHLHITSGTISFHAVWSKIMLDFSCGKERVRAFPTRFMGKNKKKRLTF